MKILRGTIFGGITFFLLGWLVWGILLMDFMMTNTNTCTARPDGVMIWWALIASNLILALFLTLVLKWSNAKTWMDGIKTGALFGLLLGFSMDLSFYSMSTMYNTLWVAVADAMVYIAVMAVVGLVIVLTWGKS